MAGVVSHTLIDKLTAMLADKVMQEVSLAVNFKADFQSICDELVAIKSLLNDAKDKRNSDSVTNWLQKLQDFLIDAVETVEKYEEEAGERNALFFFRDPFFNHRMARKIKKLKERISDIHTTGEKYIRYLASVMDVNARLNDGAFLKEWRKKSSPVPLDYQIVGMETNINIITQKVMQADEDEEGPRAIAVVGMAGIGKTLLVQHVFQNILKRQEQKGAEKRFDHLVWIPVTQMFDIKKLLLEMDRQIEDDPDSKLTELSTEGLRYRLHRNLQGKCCLFVLDDVWQKDILEQIGLAALGTSGGNRNKKNKIVVTTRDKGVSDAMGAYYTHRMKYLSEENSLELFCIHAFRTKEGMDRKLPSELQGVDTKRILEKCSRLPLAIKAIGKSMAPVKKYRYTWEAQLSRLDEAGIINRQIMPILRLSYQALPDHLKPCFLYFASFPPNTRIRSEYLVYPWIAQEFVSVTSSGVDAYDVASSYIEELVNQCMIQKSPVRWDGRVRYEMEDLMHRLALSESQEEAKCLLMPAKGLVELPPLEEYRGAHRISLMQNNISGTINEEMAIQCPRLRFLLLQKNEGITSISECFFNRLRYLAVLDLSETAIASLPKSIGDLKGLKFLNLSKTKIQKLPRSLSGLRNLQFLDVNQCENLEKLHSGIGDNKNMLHINAKGCKRLEWLPAGISELRSLRTLKLGDFEVKRKNTGNAFQLTDVKNLTRLQHLSLAFNEESISTDFPELKIWRELTKMRTLSLEYVPSSGSRQCCSIPKGMCLKYMENLEILWLRKCRLLPLAPEPDYWISQLRNLRVLVLDGDDSTGADHFKALQNLPNLKMLRLSNNESCEEIPRELGQPNAFSRLKKLEIENFKVLKSFPSIEDKALPMLKQLVIRNCNQLKFALLGLERLVNNLEELDMDQRLLVELEKVPSWKILEPKIKIKAIATSEPASSLPDIEALEFDGEAERESEAKAELESEPEPEPEPEPEQPQPQPHLMLVILILVLAGKYLICMYVVVRFSTSLSQICCDVKLFIIDML